jgi:hypothetical protein
MYEYKKGSVYFDLTADPIIYIYSGAILNLNSNFYYNENKKIFTRETEFQESTLLGWFEKIDNEWVFWQKFYGYDDEGLDFRKPDCLIKTDNLESCK